MENLPVHVSQENLSQFGSLIANTLGSKKIIEACHSMLGERLTMLLFMKKAKLEVEKARLLAAVNRENSILDRAVNSFSETEEGKHVMAAIGGAVMYQQLNKIDNLNSVMETAAEQLELQEETVNEDPVDSDWMGRFLNNASESTREDIQALWGRILAKEITKPGSYSLRTLETIRNLSKEDAELIIRANRYTISDGRKVYLFGEITDFTSRSTDLTYEDLLNLSDLGVLMLENSTNTTPLTGANLGNQSQLGLQFMQTDQKAVYYFAIEHSPASANSSVTSMIIPALLFTKVGREICTLVESNTDYATLKRIESVMVAQSNGANIKCYRSNTMSGKNELGQVIWTNLEVIPL